MIETDNPKKMIAEDSDYSQLEAEKKQQQVICYRAVIQSVKIERLRPGGETRVCRIRGRTNVPPLVRVECAVGFLIDQGDWRIENRIKKAFGVVDIMDLKGKDAFFLSSSNNRYSALIPVLDCFLGEE